MLYDRNTSCNLKQQLPRVRVLIPLALVRSLWHVPCISTSWRRSKTPLHVPQVAAGASAKADGKALFVANGLGIITLFSRYITERNTTNASFKGICLYQFVKVKSACTAILNVDFDGQSLVSFEWVNAQQFARRSLWIPLLTFVPVPTHEFCQVFCSFAFQFPLWFVIFVDFYHYSSILFVLSLLCVKFWDAPLRQSNGDFAVLALNAKP